MNGSGREKMFDFCCEDRERSSRFVLGNEGSRKLFVVGLNTSTADLYKSDLTVTKVRRIMKKKGLKGKFFDGFVISNLYPLRATNPACLPQYPD